MRVPASAPPGRAPKRELLESLDELVRRMGAQSVLFGHAVAHRFELHTTDLEVLDLLAMTGRASAGEIGRATGLSSGAVTALIDRLERSGYVARQADPSDRRRTIVVVRRQAIEPIARAYRPMQKRMLALWSEYDEEDVRLIADFLERSTALAAICLEELQDSGD